MASSSSPTIRQVPIDLHDAWDMHEFARRDRFVPTVLQRIRRRLFHGRGAVRIVHGHDLSNLEQLQTPGAEVTPLIRDLPYANSTSFKMAIEELLLGDAGYMWIGFSIIILRVHKKLDDFFTRQLRERRPYDWMMATPLPIHVVSYNPEEGTLRWEEDLKHGNTRYVYEPKDETLATHWDFYVYHVPGQPWRPEGVHEGTPLIGGVYASKHPTSFMGMEPTETGGPKPMRLACRYRVIYEYARRIGIADRNVQHAEARLAHPTSYALVAPFHESLPESVTEQARLMAQNIGEAEMSQAWERTQDMLKMIMESIDATKARAFARVSYRGGGGGTTSKAMVSAAAQARDKPSKAVEMAMSFPDLPSPMEDVEPLVDSIRSIVPGIPTYQQTPALLMPDYAQLVSSTLFDGFVSPQELLGQLETTSGQTGAAANVESLHVRQAQSDDALRRMRSATAHAFSYVYEIAFAAYDLRQYYNVIDAYDDLYRAKVMEFLGVRHVMSAKARADLVAEALGTGPTLVEARHALLLKMAKKDHLRATLLFEDEGAGEDPRREAMDPVLFEQAVGIIEVLQAAKELEIVHKDDVRRLMGELFNIDIKKKPPQLAETESLTKQVQAGIVHGKDVRDQQPDLTGMTTNRAPPPTSAGGRKRARSSSSKKPAKKARKQ